MKLAIILTTAVITIHAQTAVPEMFPVDVLPFAVTGQEYSQPLPVIATANLSGIYRIVPTMNWLRAEKGRIFGTPQTAGVYEFQVIIAEDLPAGLFRLEVKKSACEGEGRQSPWCFPFSTEKFDKVPPVGVKELMESAKDASRKRVAGMAPNLSSRYGTVERTDNSLSIFLNPRSSGDDTNVVTFDRTINKVRIAGGQWKPFSPPNPHDPLPLPRKLTRELIAAAIMGSKVVTTGSVLYYPDVVGCARYDWKTVLQTEVSVNPILYNPTDLSSYCVGDPSDPDAKADLVVVVPEIVTNSAELFGYQARRTDSLRKAPAPLMAKDTLDCNGSPSGPIPPQGIAQCDAPHNPGPPSPPDNGFQRGLLAVGYHFHWLYDRLTAPGTTQGIVTFSPVIGAGTQSFVNDVQINPTAQIGHVWLSLPTVLEKGGTTKSDLDSFTSALTLTAKLGRETPYKNVFHLKQPEIAVGAGPEAATTRALGNANSTVPLTHARDLNFVGTGTLRIPFAFSFAAQPSALTIFPLIAIQGGDHLTTHRPETGLILRRIIGIDASLRSPWQFLHNFAGDKPSTIDFSYRTTFLTYAEPYTDLSGRTPETLSSQRRSYTRISYSVPFSTYFAFKTTVQKGSLPPDFHSLGYSLSIGVTLVNPGISEH